MSVNPLLTRINPHKSAGRRFARRVEQQGEERQTVARGSRATPVLADARGGSTVAHPRRGGGYDDPGADRRGVEPAVCEARKAADRGAVSSAAATPTPGEQFEREPEIFRTGAESTIQFLYAYVAIHDTASRSWDVRDMLLIPRFG
jgi:hypothetical protein